MNQITVSSQFQETAQEIESIFTSYNDLHSIYSGSIANIKQSLDGLPYSNKQKIHNTEKAFNNALRSVNIKQKRISDQLYSQGLVLMVGNAESITREMFRNLVRNNIRKLKFAKDIALPFNRVAAANNDSDLGNIVLDILEEDRNPSSKLNFQNMQQMKGILQNYLGIEVPVYLIKDLHEYWQVRHIIVHNSGCTKPQLSRHSSVG